MCSWLNTRHEWRNLSLWPVSTSCSSRTYIAVSKILSYLCSIVDKCDQRRAAASQVSDFVKTVLIVQK